MCHLYGFLASQPTRIDCALVHSQQALVRQRAGFSRNLVRANGWGAALFRDDEPAISRRVITNHEEFRLDPKVLSTLTNAAISHIRTGTIGKAERKNTHPFLFQNWAFAHHGTVENFYTLRRELMGELDPEYRRSIQGATDSEHAFFLFLSYLKRSTGSVGGDAPLNRTLDSFVKTVEMLNEMTGRSGSLIRSRLSMILTNRRSLFACRQAGPLYYLVREKAVVCPICHESHAVMSSGEAYRSVVVATEPFSGEEWEEVPDEHVLSVDPDLEILLTPCST